jgi:hypothetical protein
MAFTPPYHISGTPIIGAATIKSSGTCKVPLKKFANAQYGPILDSADASVGTGVIDASGSHVLAAVYLAAGNYFTYVYQDSAIPKVEQRYMINMVAGPMMAYLAAESGCAPVTIWATPASYWDMKQNGAAHTQDLSIKQSFVGLTDMTPLCVVKGTKQTCKGNKFTGGFTFKAHVVVP